MSKHLRFSDEEYKELKGRVRSGVEGHATSQSANRLALRLNDREPVSSPAPSPPSPYKSKWESSYANYLDALKLAGEIVAWWYEPVRFRLPGTRNFYKADFLVLRCNAVGKNIEIHEVKGWSKNRREGITKLKTAAGLNTWATFYLVQWDRKRRAWDKQLVKV